MDNRQKRIWKRLGVEELERRVMLDGTDVLYSNALALTSLTTTTTDLDTSSSSDDSLAPEATGGVGQMTITTGANTPGIGSFASATAGPSKAGGTGNANNSSAGSAALDRALMELVEELATVSPDGQTSQAAAATA